MRIVLFNTWALFLSFAIISLGHGLQGTLIGVRAVLEGFSFIEHPDNIALALGVCESIGISKDKAIQGMRNANPDPGALKIMKIKKF